MDNTLKAKSRYAGNAYVVLTYFRHISASIQIGIPAAPLPLVKLPKEGK